MNITCDFMPQIKWKPVAKYVTTYIRSPLNIIISYHIQHCSLW